MRQELEQIRPEKTEEKRTFVRGKSAAEIARKVIDDQRFSYIACRIRCLLEVRALPADQIAAEVKEIQWPADVEKGGRRRAIGLILQATVTEERLKEINMKNQNRRFTKNIANKWQAPRRKNGDVIWEDFETEYFLKLLGWKKMWRRETRVHHGLLAEQMNAFARDKRFTPKSCEQKLRTVRGNGSIVPTFEEAKDEFIPRVMGEKTKVLTPPKWPEPNMQPKPNGHIKSAEEHTVFQMAGKLKESGHDHFGAAAAFVELGYFEQALQNLLLLVKNGDHKQDWQAIQHEFFGLVALCEGKTVPIDVALRHLEFARRGDSETGFFDAFTMHEDVSAFVNGKHEAIPKGRDYRGSSRRHTKARA